MTIRQCLLDRNSDESYEKEEPSIIIFLIFEGSFTFTCQSAYHLRGFEGSLFRCEENDV